jgi:predicted RND superfamily exporter protein
MKHMKVVVFVIIVAAVLIAAYAVGLLVRHARMNDKQTGQDTATQDLQAQMGQQSPGGRYPHATDEKTLTQVRQQREQTLEKVKNMTEEEKRRFIDKQVRDRFSVSGGREKSRKMSPEDREKLMQKVQAMTEEEKKTLGAQSSEPQATGGQEPQASPGAESTGTQQNSEKSSEPGSGQTPGQGGSEPSKAGQG